MILQRYTFGSKSQRVSLGHLLVSVAYDIAKIYIWKQITTHIQYIHILDVLLMILQRYTFGSKSQPLIKVFSYQIVAYDIAKIYIWKQITTHLKIHLWQSSCLWYCKDIHLEANHNTAMQITLMVLLLMILQRYTFGSKSQRGGLYNGYGGVAYDIAKIYIWKQITTEEPKRDKSV